VLLFALLLNLYNDNIISLTCIEVKYVAVNQSLAFTWQEASLAR